MPDAQFQNNITESDREWFFFDSWREVMETNARAKSLVARYLRRPEFELYDTVTDPAELKNLADSPDHQTQLERLKKQLNTWMKSQGDKGIETELDAPKRSAKSNKSEAK